MESEMLRKAREYERFNRERVRDTLPASITCFFNITPMM